LTQMQAELAKRKIDLDRLRVAMEILATLNEAQKFAAAAMALCNEMAARWGAERVSLGFLRGRHVRLLAMSHTEKFTRKMRLVQDLEAAMEECLDQDVEIVFPPAANSTYVSRATEALSNHHGPMNSTSLPLRRNGEVSGVLVLERRPDKTIALDEVEVLRLTCDLATSRLIDLYDHDRWLGVKAAKATRKGLAAVLGPKHTWIKLAALAIVGLILFGVLAQKEDRVEAQFTVEASEKKVVPAPFDGFLFTVAPEAEVGKEVKKGQLLATLDDSELKTKLHGAEAEKAGAKTKADIARKDGKTADEQVAEREAEKSQAEIENLELKIRQCQIVSPSDGLIFSGDLKQKIGSPVKTGDMLFEIGQRDKLRAEMEVPEDKVALLIQRQMQISSGKKVEPLGGVLTTPSHADVHIPFTVERINPVATVVNQKNVFKVRAVFDAKAIEEAGWMKPGMEGTAEVNMGKRTYAWIYTHKIADWVRLKWWMWVG